MNRTKYIEYKTYKFINRLFWILTAITLMFIAIESIVTFDSKMYISLLVEVIELCSIFCLQRLLLKTNYMVSNDPIEYLDIKVDNENYRKEFTHFKIIEFFIIASLFLWMVILELSKSLKLNPIFMINSTTLASVSSILLIATVITLIYYSLKK